MATRILIADDSLTIQKAFAMTFGGEDVTLLAARSADEGLTMARQAHPELVIADAVMPGRSGYDLCAAIKADPALRDVPVYILASVHNPYDEARGRQSGVDGQLTKPFESVALVERVRELIAKGSASRAAASPAPAPRPALAVVAPEPPGAVRAATPRPTTLPADIDDDYGEITINPVTGAPPARPSAHASSPAISAVSEVTPPPTVPLAPIHRPPVPAAGPAPLRPSLIPGLRPGAVPAARPGTAPARPPASLPGSTFFGVGAGQSPAASPPSHAPAPLPGQRGPVPAMPQVSSGPARTLVGLPTASVQSPVRFGAPAAPARPPTQPVRPLEAPRTPVPVAAAPPVSVGPTSSQAITSPIAKDRDRDKDRDKIDRIDSKIDQKIAAISARGPEYEAIAKLSREIIEKVVWEVVPELVELIVREELQKRGRV